MEIQLKGKAARALTAAVGAVTVAALALAISASPGWAQPKKSKFQDLYSFAGGTGSGANPFSGLVQDSAGNFFGTTVAGGGGGAGTVFKLAPDGTETVLYAFTDSADGGIPYAPPVLDANGNIYGTASSGGDHSCNCGVTYKIDASGKETTLHTFVGGNDGAEPFGGLAFDREGNLYGATYEGGGACNCGAVYRLSPDGAETILHAFAGGNDGAYPYFSSSLLVDKHGNLYGAAYQGGGACNCGAIYKIASSGSESVLYAFAGGSDGAYPQTNLVADKGGNLYGTTKYGGAGGGGTVFKLAADNTKTVLYAFLGSGDGVVPQAGVVADRTGDLFGTTQAGGAAGAGTIFKIAPGGGETILYSFSGGSDGDQPYAALFLGKKSELYGTTSDGGANGFGTVFAMKDKN